MSIKLNELAGKIKKEYLIYGLLAGILLLVLAMPTKESSSKEQTTDIKTELETQLTQTLERMQSIGRVWVTITMEPYTQESQTPEIRGVLVVCGNGDNPVIVQQIIETVQVLFQIESHKIKVIKMK